jgi:16S rRNA (uracil1498-N3)-methyltransferase
LANQYFVFREIPELDSTFTVENPEATHHIFNVMRAKAGDTLRMVFDNCQLGLIEVVNPVNHTVKLLSILTENPELPLDVTIAVGFPKGDKLDFIAEKATELGATAIWAAPFDWSVVKWTPEKRQKRAEKLKKIAQNAAEQSRRLKIPEIQLFDTLSNLTEHFVNFDKVLIAYEESAKSGEKSILAHTLAQKPQKLLLIFGPEGGISPAEIKQFAAHGASLMGLGPRILRAETAPLAALAAISTFCELS